ncbi:ribosome associated membrane protein RAMP4 domain-containing protein [Sarocladium implicatum]|nr:ribosome associated membrane protein RAMP4 domain-containing protein [Sarocladium implicatum]
MYNLQSQAQTPEQRRRNAKFAKENELRMGKSDDQIKKRVKEVQKSPISMFWLAILGFIIFGGLVFEVFSRFFGQ